MVSLRSVLLSFVVASCLSVATYLYLFTSATGHRWDTYKEPPLDVCHNYRKTASVKSHVSNDTSKHRNDNKPLLTLFTSWPSKGDKRDIWNATLRNWARMKPFVYPVFFSTNESQKEEILKHGWDVLPVRQFGPMNLPVLKGMFMDAICRFDSHFYGYANGDILFDNGLITTLQTILKSGLHTNRSLMVTGIRTNVNSVHLRNATNLAQVSRNKGKLFIAMSQDYFVTDAAFPWEDVPEVVIGRIGYDNFLVLYTRQRNLTTIDATDTLLAIHQTTKTGNHDGWHNKNVHHNLNILQKRFKSVRYDAGSTLCTSWRTTRNSSSGLSVIARKNINRSCYPLK